MTHKELSTNAVIKKMIAPLLMQKRDVAILFLQGLYFGVSGAAMALSMNYALDYLTHKNTHYFFMVVGVMAVLLLFGPLSAYFIRNTDNRVFRRIQKYLYESYLHAYIMMDSNIAEKYGTGQINNIFQKGADNWTKLIKAIPLDGTMIILRIVSALVLVATVVGRIGFGTVIILFALSFFIAQRGNKKLAPIRKEVRDLYIQTDRDIVRCIMSKHEILQNDKISAELLHINGMFEKILHLWYKDSSMRIFSNDIQRVGIFLIQIFLLLYVGYGVIQGTYSLGVVAMVWMLSNQINGSVKELNDYITNIHSQMIYVYKLWDVFDDAPKVVGYDLSISIDVTKGDIKLDHVSYDYIGVEVLHDFSCTFDGGKKTALVGVSGSGKSTVIKLIAGYLYPQEGSVLIDGQALPHKNNLDYSVSLRSYYPYVGYLTQEPNVFDGSIRDNLLYASTEEILEDDIYHALTRAQCHFVLDFKDGIDTQIGEKGIRLSGGQRQRLAIAKIFLKNPKIILLDEPTSALDSFSEEEVTRALDELFVGRTVIVIAHRLQTVKKADHIIVLEEGKIIERGTHQELIAKGGQYAKMLELQSGF